MTKILSGLLNVLCCLDDIFISVTTEAELGKILESILKRLHDNNIMINEAKSIMKATSLDRLGYEISEKVEAINQMAELTNIKQIH